MASAVCLSVAGAAVVSIPDGSRIASGKDAVQAKWIARSAPSCGRIRAPCPRRTGEGRRRGAPVPARAARDGAEVETVVEGDVLPSADWPENFSLLNFEDLMTHYEPALFKEDAQPGAYLANVMSKTVYTAFPEQKLSDVKHFFDEVSGLPVVDRSYVVIGVLSKKDLLKATDGGDALVTDLMSSPAITLSADKTVQDAAVLMLKNKIHRIPVVNSNGQVVGMVTRTDIFTALDNEPK